MDDIGKNLIADGMLMAEREGGEACQAGVELPCGHGQG